MHTLADWERMWQAEGAPQPHRRSGRRGGYQGADLGRLMSSLARSPVPPDSFLRAELAVLVARAREQARNDDHVRAYLRIRKRNVIGPAGITTYARVTDGNGRPDTLAQKAIDEAWWDWGRKGWCDYHARRNWRALQSMADKTKATDGDSFVRLHRGFAGNKYRFAVELVDAMHCPLTLWQDLGKRGQIRMGVEFDAAGRRVAYWIRTTERRNPDCYEIDGGLFERVPARDMLHLYDEDFVSQTRGVPIGHSASLRLAMLKGAEEAELVAARNSSAQMGFISGADDYAGDEEDPDTGDGYLDAAEPGIFRKLPQGAELLKWDPQHPSQAWPAFVKEMKRGAATGLGVAYNTLTNDGEGVNYSSLRHITSAEREDWRILQQDHVDGMVEPIRSAWLETSYLAGVILIAGRPLSRGVDYYDYAKHQPRGWQAIDPLKEEAANDAAVRRRTKTPSSIIRDQGLDPVEVWTEYAEDMRQMAALGVPLPEVTAPAQVVVSVKEED